MNCKLGIIDFALPGKRVGNIKLASELGLNGMQLIYKSSEDEPYMLDYKWMRDYYLEMGDKYSVKFLSFNVSDFDTVGMTHPKNTEKGRFVYDTIERTVEVAAYMGMDMVLYPSFMDGEIRTEEDLIITADALKYACDLASRHGIVVTSENTLSTEWISKLTALVDRKNFSISYDTQNYWRVARIDQAETLRFLQEKGLLYPEIHVKDGIGSVISSKLVGEGDANVRGSIDYLKKINYSGWLHLENYYWKEPLCRENSDVFALLKKDIELLKEMCSE